ncbi:hypothetical protein MPER_00675 [Moniliophthora perniciosa FA553]|nr:hypothetical protein MPER_00675 [Moniliophthora perniciosa FA553]
MYIFMIPHKAWAAGDTITTLVKFSPLLKGVGVLNVNTTIHETIKIYARGGGYQEHSRIVGSSKHEIIGGKAVELKLEQTYTCSDIVWSWDAVLCASQYDIFRRKLFYLEPSSKYTTTFHWSHTYNFIFGSV